MKARSSSSFAAQKLARLHGFARAMRERPTQSERLMWNELKACKLGASFRRQAVVAGVIVDFLAPARRLVIEVDGAYHGEPAQRRADARRDARLERAGYRVLRLPAELVLKDLPDVLRRVREALEG